MLAAPPTSFETPRLILRAAKTEHVASLFSEYTSRNDASQYLQRVAHSSPVQTEAFVEGWGAANWSIGRRFGWVILPRTGEQAIGLFLMSIEESKAEIHYGIGPNYWGRGFATEAGNAVMDWVTKFSPLTAVSTCCPAQHIASLKVLEKIGLERIKLRPAFLLLPSANAKVDGWICRWTRS